MLKEAKQFRKFLQTITKIIHPKKELINVPLEQRIRLLYIKKQELSRLIKEKHR